jgi:hypothetical protein
MESMGTVTLTIIEGADSLQVGPGRDKISALEQSASQCEVSLQEKRRVLGSLCQTHKLVPQRMHRLKVRPYPIKPPQPA